MSRCGNPYDIPIVDVEARLETLQITLAMLNKLKQAYAANQLAELIQDHIAEQTDPERTENIAALENQVD